MTTERNHRHEEEGDEDMFPEHPSMATQKWWRHLPMVAESSIITYQWWRQLPKMMFCTETKGWFLLKPYQQIGEACCRQAVLHHLPFVGGMVVGNMQPIEWQKGLALCGTEFMFIEAFGDAVGLPGLASARVHMSGNGPSMVFELPGRHEVFELSLVPHFRLAVSGAPDRSFDKASAALESLGPAP